MVRCINREIIKKINANTGEDSTRRRLADIGSDHALPPVAAVESGATIQAIAGEVNPGPYDAAVKQVIESGMTEVISVRRGDGLNVLSVGEADVITIAGMGGLDCSDFGPGHR